MDTGISKFSFIISITGTTRSISSCMVICTCPGRVDSPPTSIIPAPSSIISATCCFAFSKLFHLPPSEKESGVTFKIPIMLQSFSTSKKRFPIFIISLYLFAFILLTYYFSSPLTSYIPKMPDKICTFWTAYLLCKLVLQDFVPVLFLHLCEM